MTPTAHSEIEPKPATDSAAQLAALLQSAGVSPLENTGWIRVTGEDRLRWLNGMVTNSIQDLQPGEGNYNFLLSVQGRIQGDAYIFAEPDALLIETADQLTDHLEAIQMRSAQWNAAEVTLIHTHSPLVPRFELWSDPATIAAIPQTLLAAGATLCDPESLEWLRILEGTPLYGTDIRDKELPQETGQTRALHFAKGCYLGQEIVERIRSRGNVHRTFAAFHLEGALPTHGSALEAEGKQVGELTSVASIPLPGTDAPLQVALGYIRREALDRDIPIRYPDGTATSV
jgi:folate-binding protein YgfZ